MSNFKKLVALALALMILMACVPALAASDQEPYTCVVLMVGDATNEACERVAAAASEITLDKFNTTIKLIRNGYGTFSEQQNLMLASGEKLDLMCSFGLTVGTAANNGQVLALDDLLKDYGQDILSDIPEADWLCSSVDGTIYSVRNNKELATGYGYAMVKSIVDEMGIDVTTLKDEDDMTELFRKVKQAYPDMWPVSSDRGTNGWYLAYNDELGGDFGVLEDCTTDSTTVVNKIETETYYNLIKRRYDWVKEGLMMPDGSTVSETRTDLMRAGKVFAGMSNVKPGIDGEVSRTAGVPVIIVPMTKVFSTTSLLSNMWYIAWQSEQPDRAMQVLNEIYSNPELANILVNGTEGDNWVLVDEAKGVIDYPEGVTAATNDYSENAWAWPNELICYSWTSSYPEVWTDTIAFNEQAINSPAKGFAWNNSNVLAEIAACNNVKAKYDNALDCGELDPDVYIPMYIEELKAAGVDAIIAEKQAQLDAWLAAM